MRNVATCFLFSEHFDGKLCRSLKLDNQGQVEAPLAMRTIDEFRSLQLHARTVVVLPTLSATLHRVELEWLPIRKAQAAIPYALEECLVQNVMQLHFSFDKQYYQNHRYLVVVTDKEKLRAFIQDLDELSISFDLITLDWFALNEGEVAVMRDSILIHEEAFQGELRGELLTKYIQQYQDHNYLVFSNSGSWVKDMPHHTIHEEAEVFIAQRICTKGGINLCQGALRQSSPIVASRKWYQAALGLFLALLLSIPIIKAIDLQILHRKVAVLDKSIAVLYRGFFPEASRVVSPRFRVEQLLKGGATNPDAASFWTAIDVLANAYKNNTFTVLLCRYQHRVLSVRLMIDNFAALEKLQSSLKHLGLKVVQSEASSQKDKVIATLELSLS